ncbi:MAG TPA: ferrous iron transport protein A [Methanomicrobia archaeon]|nr:ferrous iron transport protein A [Methanomicrobia archaeon]
MKKLSEMNVGEKGIVKHISPSIRPVVSAMGLRLNETISIASIQPMGGPFVVSAKNANISIARAHAKNIDVEVIC